MNDIRFILFDAANTLIHKPTLWDKMLQALAAHNIHVDAALLKQRHKLVSELIFFPDNTSATFYKTFNSELLYSLGIIPNDALLNDVFKACTYLGWVPFEDTEVLKQLPLDKGILSNFNSSLFEKINNMFSGMFSTVVVSEQLKCAKPSMDFYAQAVQMIGHKPEHILYIGDSIKLDMEPALNTGMNVLLIDREDCFPYVPHRIKSLNEILQNELNILKQNENVLLSVQRIETPKENRKSFHTIYIDRY